MLPGQPLHPLKHALQIFTDASGGRSLRRAHCKRYLVPSRKQTAHKPFRAKSSFSSSKRLSNPLLQQDSTNSYRQHNSGCLYKQRGGMKLGSLCALLWRILSWCTRNQVTLRACHIPGWLNVIADKLPRLCQTIQTEWSLHPEVFQAPGGTSPKWTCLPPDSTTNYFSLCHWYQTPRHGQWMHSAFPGRIWTHMPFHQQPSWAKWWKSYRTPLATG